MSWVGVTNTDVEIRCIENDASSNNKKYRYESKINDDVQVVCHENNSPTETSIQSPLHKFLKSILTGNIYPNEMESTLISIKNELESSIEKDVTVSEVEQERIASEKELENKYLNLYTDFSFFLKEYDMTPLELIIATSHCLGVGKPREIIRAFFGYFQTYCGEKGTNVIAIGSPASGKSFTLETALSMIPSERIYYGAKTVAYFFRKFNKRDLTGYIFFIGDLGGSDDDVDTIKFRDKLKQLTTDGYAERGVVDKDSMEEEDQWVKGYPSLSYTTAREEMVNEQEKTRSILLTPTMVDTGKLIVFKHLMENHGAYRDELEKLFSIRDSIKGLVYKFNPREYDWFNPYMFAIEEHLRNHDDFPRKIDEYNAILKLVTILNNPEKLQHHMYYDDNFEETDTDVFISSKRDNINALNIFNSANLLPDETRFANGIIKEYDVFSIDVDTIEYDEDDLWEDQVRKCSDLMYCINDEDGRIEITKDVRKYCFTLKSLARDHRNKRWYRKSKNYINDRVQKLVEENILINVGKEKSSNHNVYALNQGMTSSVDSPLPNFEKGNNLVRASHLFSLMFPSQVDEYMEFLESDVNVDTTDIFEVIKPIIPDLPYLDGVYDEL